MCAIDPAAKRLAYALFRNGVLYEARYADDMVGVAILRDTIWVLETPQYYRSRSETHKDLDRLVAKLRAVRALIAQRCERYVEFKPHEWKGNVPKAIHHKRLASVLTPAELAVLPALGAKNSLYAHDLWDAAGLGLRFLKRVGRGGSDAGS